MRTVNLLIKRSENGVRSDIESAYAQMYKYIFEEEFLLDLEEDDFEIISEDSEKIKEAANNWNERYVYSYIKRNFKALEEEKGSLFDAFIKLDNDSTERTFSSTELADAIKRYEGYITYTTRGIFYADNSLNTMIDDEELKKINEDAKDYVLASISLPW